MSASVQGVCTDIRYTDMNVCMVWYRENISVQNKVAIISRMRSITWLCLFFLKSGARINISDGSSTERIVTITGASEVIFKAFAMIAEKFEEVWHIILNGKKNALYAINTILL